MGWIKFTNTKTGEVYDSREPIGSVAVYDGFQTEDKDEPQPKQISSDPLFRYPYGHPDGPDIEALERVMRGGKAVEKQRPSSTKPTKIDESK